MNPILIGVAIWLLRPKKKASGKSPKFKDAIIRKEVLSLGYSETLARLMIAQAKVESNNFTSHLFLATNNAYGYKCVQGSKFQSGCKVKSPEGDYYASYRSLQDSTLEILYWLKRREREGKFIIKDLTTATKYATAIKKGGFFGGTTEAYSRLMNLYL